MAFASEPKNLMGLCGTILPFQLGCYWDGARFVRYADAAHVDQFTMVDEEIACARLHDLIVEGVKKRLDADAPIGFLLSGGLDSSLVCAIAQRESSRPIRTFAVGMDVDAIDLKYARQVADFIGSDHTEVVITREDVLEALPKVVELLATYDITTIRASMGMYLACKYIHKHTDIRVLMTGEISDELFGYKYTDFAPDPAAFQEEAEKRVRELHIYDVLRADRCISVNSLEARVPFGDLAFVRHAMRIDPALKMSRHDMANICSERRLKRNICCPKTSSGARRRRSRTRWGTPWRMTSSSSRTKLTLRMRRWPGARAMRTRSPSRRRAFCTASCSSASIPGRAR